MKKWWKFCESIFLNFTINVYRWLCNSYLNHYLNFPELYWTYVSCSGLKKYIRLTTKFDLHYEEVHILEDVSLNLFLGMAMISLKLWELGSVTGQLALLIAQVIALSIYLLYNI